MNIEEAGQVILEGKAWVDCQTCAGNGWVELSKVSLGDALTTAPDGSTRAVEDCYGCGGLGEFPREEYLEACRVIGMEPPKWTKAEAAQRNYFVRRGLTPEGFTKPIDSIVVGRCSSCADVGHIEVTSSIGVRDGLPPYRYVVPKVSK